MIVSWGSGTTADEHAARAPDAMSRLSTSLALAVALSAVPDPAHANPTTVSALRTTAIATEPGIAESMTAPPATTTEVRVAVTTEPTSPPPPKLEAPPPPTPMELYEREVASQVRDDRKSGRGLLAGGLSLAGTAYLVTSMAGALAIDRARDITDDPATPEDEAAQRQSRREFGRALLIPGVGPALAIARSDSAVRAWAAGVAGLTQALGVGLAALGTHRLLRARRLERMSLSAMGSRRSAALSLQVRF